MIFAIKEGLLIFREGICTRLRESDLSIEALRSYLVEDQDFVAVDDDNGNFRHTIGHEEPDPGTIIYLYTFDRDTVLIVDFDSFDKGVSLLAIGASLLVEIFQDDDTGDRLCHEEYKKESDKEYRDPVVFSMHGWSRFGHWII